jgi:hypothetical protein
LPPLLNGPAFGEATLAQGGTLYGAYPGALRGVSCLDDRNQEAIRVPAINNFVRFRQIPKTPFLYRGEAAGSPRISGTSESVPAASQPQALRLRR